MPQDPQDVTQVPEETPPPPRLFTPPQNGEVITYNNVNYYLGNFIGKGSFGGVYECTDDWGNELVAKVLLPLNRSYEEVKEEWLKELQKLAYLRHPAITFVHSAFEYRDTFYLILERCSSTLYDLINMPDLLPDVWIPYVSRDVLQAVHFIHSGGYVHKDIHPGNVFMLWLKDRMNPAVSVLQFKVGDLGISNLESDIDIFNTILADWMLPPEAIDPTEFGIVGKQVDVYHTGLLLLSLLLKGVPTFTKDEIVAGKPRQVAESLSSPYALPIAKTLRRHVAYRTQTAIDFWKDIATAFFSSQAQSRPQTSDSGTALLS